MSPIMNPLDYLYHKDCSTQRPSHSAFLLPPLSEFKSFIPFFIFRLGIKSTLVTLSRDFS